MAQVQSDVHRVYQSGNNEDLKKREPDIAGVYDICWICK